MTALPLILRRAAGWPLVLFALLVMTDAGWSDEILLAPGGKQSGWSVACEGQTAVTAEKAQDTLVLGGKSSTGERCRISREDFAQTANWAFLLAFSVSHPDALGGNPFEIELTDRAGNGYRAGLTNAELSLYRLTGGTPELLGKTHRTTPASTERRELIFSRTADGLLQLRLDRAVVQAAETTAVPVQRLTVSYAVYAHGYALRLLQCVLKGEPGTPTDAAVPVAGPVTWRHPQTRIGILDTDPLQHPFLRNGWATAAARALQAQGCKAQTVLPGALATTAKDIDLLLLDQSQLADDDLPALLAYLKAGKGVWLLSAQPFGKNLYARNGEQWTAFSPEQRPEASRDLLHRLSERLIGTAPVEELNPTAVPDARLSLSAEGKSIWNALPAQLEIPFAALVPLNNSITMQSLPAWVTRQSLLTTRYKAKNWVQHEDNFTAAAAQLLRHTAGEFAGTSVALTSFPVWGRSPLNPAEPAFASWVVALCNALAEAPQVVAWPAARQQPPVTRTNFFSYPGALMAPLCFGSHQYLRDEIFAEDLNRGSFPACQFSIPWRKDMDENGDVVDWVQMDAIVAAMERLGKAVIFDPYCFSRWRGFSWSNQKTSLYDEAFKQRYLRAMTRIAERYRERPAMVALFVTPHTGIGDFRVDRSSEAVAQWQRFLHEKKRYSLAQLRERYGQNFNEWQEVPVPEEKAGEPYNVGAIWADYWEFHATTYQNFLRSVITSVRAVTPELPLLLRGPYLELGLNMSLAAQYPNVACHCECVETSIDTEGYYRSLGKTFGVHTGAENGWPKCSLPALRMSFADYLMGDHSFFLYSFGGPRGAREGFADLQTLTRIKQATTGAHYPDATLGILIADTTLYASKPASFFAMEKRPHLEGTLERLGFPFTGISASFPRLNRLRTLLDDGSNEVMTPQLRQQLRDWILAGGTLIAFPATGRVSFDGSAETLAGALGLEFKAGIYSLGKGQVIVLDTIPVSQPQVLETLLLPLQTPRDFLVTPSIAQAGLTRADGRRFLVLYQKEPELLRSFFTESSAAAALRKIKATEVEITPQFSFTTASDLESGRELIPENAKIRITVPATEYRVLEFR